MTSLPRHESGKQPEPQTNPHNETPEQLVRIATKRELVTRIASMQRVIRDEYLSLIEVLDTAIQEIDACPHLQKTRKERMQQSIIAAKDEIYLTIGARAVGHYEYLLAQADVEIPADASGEGGA